MSSPPFSSLLWERRVLVGCQFHPHPSPSSLIRARRKVEKTCVPHFLDGAIYANFFLLSFRPFVLHSFLPPFLLLLSHPLFAVIILEEAFSPLSLPFVLVPTLPPLFLHCPPSVRPSFYPTYTNTRHAYAPPLHALTATFKRA